MLQLPAVLSRDNLPGFDYISAHRICAVDPGSFTDTEKRNARELYSRILLAHGVSIDPQLVDELQALRRAALDLIREHVFEQTLMERKLGSGSLPVKSPAFELRSGWEADVFISNRPPYTDTVLKVYRLHFLGGNPEHPGYGWVIDPDLIAPSSSGTRRLPDTHFKPNPTMEKLRSRFFRASRLPFWAQVSSIYETPHALVVQQQRVSSVKENFPEELDRAAWNFLAGNHGVYFTNTDGDLKNVGSVDSAVILHRSRFYLIQDYYYNLGFPLDPMGAPDKTKSPVMFDGHALPLTPRYVQNFPSLAHAVLMIHQRYPHVPQDPSMIDIANQIACPTLRQDPRAIHQTYNLYPAPALAEPLILHLPFDSLEAPPKLVENA